MASAIRRASADLDGDALSRFRSAPWRFDVWQAGAILEAWKGRMDKKGDELIAVCNFTSVTRENYRIGVPDKGTYRIVLNTDSVEFGGSGTKMQKTYTSKPIPMHSFGQSISLTLPGLSVVYLKKQGKNADNKEE